jgi:predicted DNA binding protein
MLIHAQKKYIKSRFNDEAELEKVIIENYEYLFGPSSIFLPKAKIKTADGAGTIPDGFVIDINEHKWYLVEAELLHHRVWSHIAPQVIKQLLAAQQSNTKDIIIELTVEQYNQDAVTREKFDEMNVSQINVRKVISDILSRDPIVAIPIDELSEDLTQWAETLKYVVKLWRVRKFVEFGNSLNVVYDFPEEYQPELNTEELDGTRPTSDQIKSADVWLEDLIEEGFLTVGESLIMQYKKRGSDKVKQYKAVVQHDGALEVLGNNYNSPSYAALAGLQDAGSDRKTVNGWTAWKNDKGEFLADLREKYILKQMQRN